MKLGMMKKWSAIWFFIFFSVVAATRREVPFSSGSFLLPCQIDVFKRLIEPTLPAPVLHSEPPYTQGSTNTLYWESGHLIETLRAMRYRLLVFEIEAQIDTLTLWGFVNAGVDSAVFVDLPEGIRIAYRLRYYAENPDGHYEMSHWSSPVFSLQDIRPPRLIRWDVEGLHRPLRPILWDVEGLHHVAHMQDWVVGQTTRNRVVASDSLSGGVMGVVMVEKSLFSEDTMYYDLEMPSYSVDTVISYRMLTPSNESILLTLWVVDAAGHVSEKVTRSLFWWSADPQEPPVICYPNPFRPSFGEKAVIKLHQGGFRKGRIFDPFGHPIKVLIKSEESLFFEWDGTNQEGQRVSRGGYIFVIDGRTDLYCKIAVY